MKPDYKNWIPKGMLYSLIAGTVLSLALLLIFGVFGIGVSGKLRIALGVVFGIAFVICAKCTEWCVHAYRSFSYDGERKLSKQIIEGTAHYVTLPGNHPSSGATRHLPPRGEGFCTGSIFKS